MNKYSSIKPLVIARYQECGNIAQTAREFKINKKTVRAWLIKEEVNIKPTNIDIMGHEYGRLIVKGCVGKDKNHKYIWECLCECGQITTARANDLRQGKIKSCGCLHKEASAINGKKNKGSISPNRKYCGEMSGRYYSQVKYNAIRRGFKFFVTKQDLWNLFLQQNRICALSGLELEINKTASVDRIDSSKEYTNDNIQWVHKDINKMKLHHNQDYFIDLCKKVCEYNNNV